MNKDTIIGIVGAVVLIAAMVGVFKYEGSQAQAGLGSQQFDVTWATESANGPSTTGETALGESTEDALAITRANLTRAEFTLTWAPGEGSTDTLKLTITPPEGSGLDAQTVEDDDGELVIEFTGMNTAPEDVQFFANNEEDAHARLATQYTKQKGTGNWTVLVEFTNAQGVNPVPGVPDPTRDSAVAWELNSILDAYAPTVSDAQ